MVFHPEGQFQQFPHCKFRENITRLLYIPSILPSKSPSHPDHLYLVVSKFGKVGLYHPSTFSLLYTYCLDLSVNSARADIIPPKCERTHLVTDAIFSKDTHCVIFSTTKCILQWYDIGEIQSQDIGLGLFPRHEFLSLSLASFPINPHFGHVECHRLSNLPAIPSCMECPPKKLIIGDVSGSITIISFPNTKHPLGRRKIRGRLHQIPFPDLPRSIIQTYKAHHCPVTDIQLIPERSLILTSSKDKKFSVYVKDTSDTPLDSIIVSISKGVNSITYSQHLKMIATGSDDYVVRLFNQFVMKMPQMEMLGHKSPVIAVKFVKVAFPVTGAEQQENPVLLLSYSADSELRAWDPLTFICLQSLYLSFPIGSTIICKTPEFATKSLVLQIPQTDPQKKDQALNASDFGEVILLYCNSFARIPLEKEGSTRFQGINYDQFIREFEELSGKYERKLKEKLSNDEKEFRKPQVFVHHATPPPPPPSESHVSPGNDSEEEDKFDENLEKNKPNFCVRLSKQDKIDMDKKVEAYVKEILELRKSIKEADLQDVKKDLRDAGEEDDDDREPPFVGSEDPLKVSIQATKNYYDFRRKKDAMLSGLPKGLQRVLTYGRAFNQYPLMNLEPVQFSRSNLPIPESMKDTLGIKSVSSVEDILSPEAHLYFGIESIPEEKSVQLPRLTGGRNHSDDFTYRFNTRPKGKKTKPTSFQQRNNASSSRFSVIGRKMTCYEEEKPLSPTFEESEVDAEEIDLFE